MNSNISCTQSPNLNVSVLGSQLVVFAQSIEARCWVENEDVVVAERRVINNFIGYKGVTYIRGLTVLPYL